MVKTYEGIVKHMSFFAFRNGDCKEVVLHDEFFDRHEIYNMQATKEDYIEACENVRKLFDRR